MESPDVHPGSEDVTYWIIKASQEQLILSVQTLLLPSTTTSEFHKLFLKIFIVGDWLGLAMLGNRSYMGKGRLYSYADVWEIIAFHTMKHTDNVSHHVSLVEKHTSRLLFWKLPGQGHIYITWSRKSQIIHKAAFINN